MMPSSPPASASASRNAGSAPPAVAASTSTTSSTASTAATGAHSQSPLRRIVTLEHNKTNTRKDDDMNSSSSNSRSGTGIADEVTERHKSTTPSTAEGTPTANAANSEVTATASISASSAGNKEVHFNTVGMTPLRSSSSMSSKSKSKSATSNAPPPQQQQRQQVTPPSHPPTAAASYAGYYGSYVTAAAAAAGYPYNVYGAAGGYHYHHANGYRYPQAPTQTQAQTQAMRAPSAHPNERFAYRFGSPMAAAASASGSSTSALAAASASSAVPPALAAASASSSAATDASNATATPMAAQMDYQLQRIADANSGSAGHQYAPNGGGMTMTMMSPYRYRSPFKSPPRADIATGMIGAAIMAGMASPTDYSFDFDGLEEEAELLNGNNGEVEVEGDEQTKKKANKTTIQPVTWAGYEMAPTTATATATAAAAASGTTTTASAVNAGSSNSNSPRHIPPPPPPPQVYYQDGYVYHGCPPPPAASTATANNNNKVSPQNAGEKPSRPSSSKGGRGSKGGRSGRKSTPKAKVAVGKAPYQVSPSSSSSSSSGSPSPSSPATLFSPSCPFSMSAAASPTVATFADAQSAHAAAVAALNGSDGGVGSTSPSTSIVSSSAAGGGAPDKFEAASAAAAAASSKRKGRGRPRSGTVSMAGAEVDDPSVESADAESADAYVDAEGRSRRVRPSSLEKQEQRANMFDKIRRVMDLSGQEEWLNAQGRRTLRDPLDDVAICPSSAIFRGCMEMYRVPNTSNGVTITEKGVKFETGPFRQQSPGQLCLRCIFCAPHLSDDEKGTRGARTFPQSTKGIEQSMRNFYRAHLRHCPYIPAKVNELLLEVRDAKIRTGNLRGGKFHERVNALLNLVDDENGDRVWIGRGGLKFADGTTWADRGYGDGPGMRPIPTGPPPTVVPMADGAEIAGSGSETVDVDSPFVPGVPSKTKKRGRKPAGSGRKPAGSGAKKGRKPKKAKLNEDVESKASAKTEIPAQMELEMEMAPFIAEATDSTITVGGMPPSFFGGFDDLFSGIEESSDPITTHDTAAVSPPQEFDLHVQSNVPAPSIPSESIPAPVPSKPRQDRPPEPSPPQQPVIRTSRGRISKRRNWGDFATDETDIDDRIEGAERRERAWSLSSAVANPIATASNAPVAVASLGKSLAAYKTPKKSDPIEGTVADAATVTPTPTAKAKAKSKTKPKPKKRRPAKKSKPKKQNSDRITYVSRGGMHSGKWAEEETAALLDAMKVHKKNWFAVAEIVGTRTPAQCKSKNQKLELRDYYD